jgi:hypothetical protein
LSFGGHGRFYLAGLFTIVAVTYVLAPWIVNLIDAGRDYNPFYYEPKDDSRQAYAMRQGQAASAGSPWRVAVNVTLVSAVVLAWLIVLPRR